MNTDPYLATKDIEERKRLCAEHMRTHSVSADTSRNSYYKISPLWCHRTVTIFKSWRKAKEEVFLQIQDSYLIIRNTEEKKRIVAEHMRAHIKLDNMSNSWYKKNYPLWESRAMYLFKKKWRKALEYAFTKKEVQIWEKCVKKKRIETINITHKNNIKYTREIIIDIFVKEYLRLKSLPKFGIFTIEKYEKYKNKDCPYRGTIERFFGSFKNFYMQITNMYPNIYFDPIVPYVEEDYKYALVKAYKDNGFISQGILRSDHGYINAKKYMEKYGSIRNACETFNIPYKDKVHRSKLFLRAKKEIENLLPLEMIEEKKWPWLRYKKPLSIDIFIQFLNLAFEIDGKQHYEESKMFNSRGESLQKRQARDNVKNTELPKHNITLIRIKYSEIHKIPEILKYYVELLKTIQEYCAY